MAWPITPETLSSFEVCQDMISTTCPCATGSQRTTNLYIESGVEAHIEMTFCVLVEDALERLLENRRGKGV